MQDNSKDVTTKRSANATVMSHDWWTSVARQAQEALEAVPTGQKMIEAGDNR